MSYTKRRDVRKLVSDPLGFAILMEDCELEDVIVTYVAVLISRKTKRGDQD